MTIFQTRLKKLEDKANLNGGQNVRDIDQTKLEFIAEKESTETSGKLQTISFGLSLDVHDDTDSDEPDLSWLFRPTANEEYPSGKSMSYVQAHGPIKLPLKKLFDECNEGEDSRALCEPYSDICTKRRKTSQ